MKKPVLIRIIGWIGWVCFGALILCIYFYFSGSREPIWTLGTLVFGLPAAVCWAIWGVASAVVWVVRRTAPTAGMGELSARAPHDRAENLYPHPAVMSFYCVRHKRWVDKTNIAEHDTRECLYVPNLPSRFPRPTMPEHEAPVMTSPLGLNQK